MTVLARAARTGFLAVLVCVTAAFAARPPEVETTFHNSVDIAGFRTCHWGAGEPAANRQLEDDVRARVGRILANKGYRWVSAPGDCVVRTLTRQDEYFPAGVFVLEVFDHDTGSLAWRARISGLFGGDRQKMQRVLKRSIKKALKDFPKARAR